MTENSKLNNFFEKFAEFSAKLGQQIHLRSLRDAFSTIMPAFILAGLATLINFVVFPWMFTGETLEQAQIFGTSLSNGTLNLAGVLIAPMIAYFLSTHRGFDKPLSAIIVSLAALIIVMPMTTEAMPVGGEEMIEVTGVLSFNDLGTNGMFAGIIVGLLATEILIKLANIDKLEINLGEDVPPAAGASFTTMLPLILTLTIFGILTLILNVVFDTNIIDLIARLVQAPLQNLTSNLIGFLLIYSTGNFLFTLGIHQSTISASLLDPIMITNMNENMLAAQAGETPPHILNYSFMYIFGQMSGTGITAGLIIAVLLFVKYKPYEDITKLSIGPGLFNINEPIIFGLPIVFNLPMMIPFVLSPIISVVIAYFATAIGFIDPFTIMVPWTTPPLISAFLASGGDFKAVILQLIILVIITLIYIPFLKISQRVDEKTAELANE